RRSSDLRDEVAGLTFLSSNPEHEHHMLLLLPGRVGEDTVVQQISFRCTTLADVMAFHERLVDAGASIDKVLNHGNAVGVYFWDPEGNRCEVYWPTELPAAQPFLKDIDLRRPEEDVLATVRADVEAHGAQGYIEPHYRRPPAGDTED
ncbi:MAG: VOC family protein, partial [Acidimicrobiales bacterium]